MGALGAFAFSSLLYLFTSSFLKGGMRDVLNVCLLSVNFCTLAVPQFPHVALW